jgi:hypothetical protein
MKLMFKTVEECYKEPKISKESASKIVNHIMPEAISLYKKFGTPIKETIEKVVILSRKLEREKNLMLTKEYLFRRIEFLTKKRYRYTAYENSIELKNANENYAIFIQNGWIYFSDKFKASSIYSFLKRLSEYIEKMYENENMRKGEQVIQHIIKTAKKEGTIIYRSEFLNFSSNNGLNITLEGQFWLKISKISGSFARVWRKTNLDILQKTLIAGIQIMKKDLVHLKNFGIKPHKVIPDNRAPNLFRVRYSPIYN